MEKTAACGPFCAGLPGRDGEAWIPGLRLRFAPATPGMTKVRGLAGRAKGAGARAFRACRSPSSVDRVPRRPPLRHPRATGPRAAFRFVILGRSRPKAVAETRGSMPRRVSKDGTVEKGARAVLRRIARPGWRGMDPGSAPPLRSGYARDDEGEGKRAGRRVRERGRSARAGRYPRSTGFRAAFRFVILGRSRPKAVAETRGSMPRRVSKDGTMEKTAACGLVCAGLPGRDGEAWIPGLRLRFAPATPGMTKVRGCGHGEGCGSAGVPRVPVAILDRPERAAFRFVILGRSRPKAVAQTRGSMPRRRSSGGPMEKGAAAYGLFCTSASGRNGEAWIPDTSSFAALGRRSGMTKGRGACLQPSERVNQSRMRKNVR
jgi:hypothetical protein